MNEVEHQFNLFAFNAMRPKIKVPISAARIKAAKAMMKSGNVLGAIENLREVRYRLEAFESRLNRKSKEVANG